MQNNHVLAFSMGQFHFFSKEQVMLKPREQRCIKIGATFIDEISCLLTVKMLYIQAQNTVMFYVKLIRNSAILDAISSSL